MGIRYDKVACTQPNCNFMATLMENVGTTCGYFNFCPACGIKGSLNNWRIELRDVKEKQVFKQQVRA
jgi:hypothetical protein